jgi:serine/threonine protein kinase
MSSFRQQLQDSNFDLNIWLQGQLASTILSKSIIDGLGYMKSNNAGPWKLVQRMLQKDPQRRPTVTECLSIVQSWSVDYSDIPFPDQTNFQLQQQQSLHASFMRTVVGFGEDDADDGSGTGIMEDECAIPEDQAAKVRLDEERRLERSDSKRIASPFYITKNLPLIASFIADLNNHCDSLHSLGTPWADFGGGYCVL